MSVQCFYVRLSGLSRIELRRYCSGREHRCPANDHEYSYCNAAVTIDVQPTRYHDDPEERERPTIVLIDPQERAGDSRWPTACEKCGLLFQPHDPWQVNQRVLYRGPDGSEWTRTELPPGAIYDAFWLKGLPMFTGPDGLALMCVCPDRHHWCIDGEASNCTRKGDHSHKCWVRHGTPPNLTVDKDGNTCAAGAGSIQTGKWHGFLRNGQLVE